LATQGWRIAASDLPNALSLGSPLPTGAAAYPLDVIDLERVRQASARILSEIGVPDLVMLCAGIFEDTRLDAFDAATHARIMAVNYIGVVNAIDAVLPAMLAKRRGRIVLLGSLAGYRRGRPGITGYGPSKAALINLAEGLSAKLRGTGVNVSIVNIGMVRTPLLEASGRRSAHALSPERAAEKILKGIEKQRFEIRFPFWAAQIVAIAGALPRPIYRLATYKRRKQ
jgi:short-subunit dehydrogenase